MNILSIVNAGKRQYGENHWLWAIWTAIDMTPESEQHSTWNKTEPTAKGFCPSKQAAKRAAWAAIKSHSPDWPRAYERSWCRQMLWEKQTNDSRPFFSRCKAGKDKWLWVVHKEICYWDNEPIVHGFATSPELAHEQAAAAVGPLQQAPNMMAEHFRSKQAALKRSQRKATTSGTTALEFVYNCHSYYSDFDGGRQDSITPYRIVKKTKKRIYVEAEPYREDRSTSGDWRDFVVDTFVLDRSHFEKTGKARRNKGWYNTFYSDPAIYHAERRSTDYRPECFVGLGVPAGATVKEIQSAYRRLARKTHPDSGGDAEEFKKVHAWFEDAMAMVSAA